MFEGQINRASFGEARESEVLREFRWTDLVAKLSATRDLRDELSRHGEGDFHAFPEIRRQSCDSGGEEGKPAVNHGALRAGKAEPVNLEATARSAVHGDREKE